MSKLTGLLERPRNNNNDEVLQQAAGGLIVVLLAIMLFVGIVTWHGYVFSILWEWFAVPLFNLRPLAIPEAIGVMLVCFMLTHQTPPKETGSNLIFSFVRPAFLLVMGWVLHTYFMG